MDSSSGRQRLRVDEAGSCKSTAESAISLDGFRQNQQQQQQQQKQSFERQSYWPFLILFCSLLISIGNTLLLSFVFKSMQTNDELTNFGGKIEWDEASSSNLLQIPAELRAGARMKLNSLERVSGDPLELLVRFDAQQNDQSEIQVKFIEQLSAINRDKSQFNTNEDKLGAGYFALNLNATHDELISSEDKLRKTLELGTRWLLMNKIHRHTNRNKYQDQFSNANINSKHLININDKTVNTVTRLMELDTQEASVTLPMQKQLTTSAQPNLKAQVKVEEKLICPHLQGSIESDLDLQARGTNLVCQANDALLARSKSGDVKLSFYDNIHLEAPEIELDAKDVFIPKGLRYFDSVPPTKPPQDKQSSNDNNMDKNLEQHQAQKLPTDYEALELITIGDQLATADSDE